RRGKYCNRSASESVRYRLSGGPRAETNSGSVRPKRSCPTPFPGWISISWPSPRTTRLSSGTGRYKSIRPRDPAPRRINPSRVIRQPVRHDPGGRHSLRRLASRVADDQQAVPQMIRVDRQRLLALAGVLPRLVHPALDLLPTPHRRPPALRPVAAVGVHG